MFSFVPNGKLIFFPNKQYMNECYDLWKNSFKETPLFKEEDEKELREKNLKAFKENSRINDKGAILFAVCRGNFDEGIIIII